MHPHKQLLQTHKHQPVTCHTCKGGGFASAGTGYDNVCDTCAGQGQVPLQQVMSEHALHTYLTDIQAHIPYNEQTAAQMGVPLNLLHRIVVQKKPVHAYATWLKIAMYNYSVQWFDTNTYTHV